MWRHANSKQRQPTAPAPVRTIWHRNDAMAWPHNGTPTASHQAPQSRAVRIKCETMSSVGLGHMRDARLVRRIFKRRICVARVPPNTASLPSKREP